MQLTTEAVAKYVGGQMEIQNQGEGYIYRGEINSITVEKGTLRVGFSWLAKGDAFPPTKWHKSDADDYEMSLEMCGVSNIGDERIALHAPIVGEMIILFPPNGSKLDPSKVVGFRLN